MNDKINIILEKDEAIVLFDFLARFNQNDNKEVFEDQAEQKILWDIESILEKQLTEPLLPNYKDKKNGPALRSPRRSAKSPDFVADK